MVFNKAIQYLARTLRTANLAVVIATVPLLQSCDKKTNVAPGTPKTIETREVYLRLDMTKENKATIDFTPLLFEGKITNILDVKMPSLGNASSGGQKPGKIGNADYEEIIIDIQNLINGEDRPDADGNVILRSDKSDNIIAVINATDGQFGPTLTKRDEKGEVYYAKVLGFKVPATSSGVPGSVPWKQTINQAIQSEKDLRAQLSIKRTLFLDTNYLGPLPVNDVVKVITGP